MRTRSPSHRTLTTKQKSGDSHDRTSSNKENAVDHMRAAVSGGDENICSSLSQRLVKFVWFPSDPFQVHEPKATFMTSLAVSYIYFNHVYMVAKYIASWILKQSSVKYV